MGTHRFDARLSIRCGINSCTEQYKNFESFRSHVYRKRREVLVSDSAPIETLVDSSLDRMDSETDGDGGEEDVEIERRTQFNDDPKRSAALFLLKTREERKVTQTALNGIVEDFQGLWRDAMERLQVKLRTLLVLLYIIQDLKKNIKNQRVGRLSM